MQRFLTIWDSALNNLEEEVSEKVKRGLLYRRAQKSVVLRKMSPTLKGKRPKGNMVETTPTSSCD